MTKDTWSKRTATSAFGAILVCSAGWVGCGTSEQSLGVGEPDAASCADAVCEDTAGSGGGDDAYRYIAIRSVPAFEEELYTVDTPGPDVDAIELLSGGVSYFAEVVEDARTGEGGEPANAHADPEAALGELDAVPRNGGVCDLTAGFWSMGGWEGYGIVSFGRPLVVGDVVTVWEMDDIHCDNISTTPPDGYEVWLGNTLVDPFGEDWILLGASTQIGGLTTLSVDTLDGGP